MLKFEGIFDLFFIKFRHLLYHFFAKFFKFILSFQFYT